MLNRLETLQVDVVQYRQAVDKIFSLSLMTSDRWQACFKEILLCTARLYLDYLLITNDMPELEGLCGKATANRSVSTDWRREKKLREELTLRLGSSEWPGFVPENAFSDLTGFGTVQDYANSFTLHLPEIYEETFRIEACLRSFLSHRDSASLSQLSVGLQHLGRHHVSFVLQPLEWVAEDGSWE